MAAWSETLFWDMNLANYKNAIRISNIYNKKTAPRQSQIQRVGAIFTYVQKKGAEHCTHLPFSKTSFLNSNNHF